MRQSWLRISVLIWSLFFCFSLSAKQSLALPAKDWTFLIYLNGNNSLDPFGTLNLQQLEKIGSTANINIVVQWASLKTKTVRRLLIQKSTNPAQVTSPVIEEIKADMGDWHSVVEFVAWGAAHYPADHYFVDLWDHGSGWHSKQQPEARDISWDEISGHHITTAELGLALHESAKAIGHKIDLYASDACLMAMIEIASEVKDSVSIFAGSEQIEPGEGWPYDQLMARWNQNPKIAAAELAKILSEEYRKKYQNQNRGFTFSVFDLNFLPQLEQSLSNFAQALKTLSGSNLRKAINAAQDAQTFTHDDYVDLVDYLDELKLAQPANVDAAIIGSVRTAVQAFVIQNNQVNAPRAHGVSIWIPTNSLVLNKYGAIYSQLKFDRETAWSEFLRALANPHLGDVKRKGTE